MDDEKSGNDCKHEGLVEGGGSLGTLDTKDHMQLKYVLDQMEEIG